MKLPRTILADDHTIIVDGLKRLLQGHADIIATCGDGAVLHGTVQRLRPDLLITDIQMPSLSGLEFLRASKAAGFVPRTIILSMFNDESIVTAAFRAGARGYVPKHAAGEELIDAVRDVMAGRPYVSRLLPVAHSIGTDEPIAAPRAARLTARQKQVLKHIAHGKRMKEIAAALELSRRTVEMHKYHMMRTLNLKTTAELIQYYVKNESLDLTLDRPVPQREVAMEVDPKAGLPAARGSTRVTTH